MRGGARCWPCAALGLLVSGLIHAAAAGWWLWERGPDTGLQETQAEALMVELDLAAFSSAPAEALTGSTAAPAASPEHAPAEPEAVTLAAEPEPTQGPGPEQPSQPAAQAPEQPEPTLASIRPEPDTPVEPEIAPEAETQAPAPPTPRPEPRIKRTETRPIKPPNRPKKEVHRQAPKPDKRAKPKAADPEPPKRAAAVVDSRAKTPTHHTQAPGVGSTGSDAATAPAGASGRASAPRAAGNAEAAYLAGLQRAIARHQRFPDDARKRRKTGVATLSFVVQGDGSIRKVRVAKSSGDASLDEAAVQAMRRLNRFKPIPAIIGRQEWAMRVPIRFDLK